MGRSRSRVDLQEGLSLNINRLVRLKFITPGGSAGPYYLTWSYSYSGEKIATAILTSDHSSSNVGWLHIRVGDLVQRIATQCQDRHFGGGQWYFVCPCTHRLCSVLWLPAGARRFASRQTWGRQVAYHSQFQTRHDRALSKAQAIRAKLGGPNWAGIDEFDPPKPRGMRWRTYNRLVAISRDQEAIAD